jgi:hypothetical protein
MDLVATTESSWSNVVHVGSVEPVGYGVPFVGSIVPVGSVAPSLSKDLKLRTRREQQIECSDFDAVARKKLEEHREKG